MREQHGPTFTPVARRTSATEEDLAQRRRTAGQQTAQTTTRHPVQRLTNDYPPASPHQAGHFAGIHPEDTPDLSQEVWHTRRSPVAGVEEEELDYPSDPPRRRTTVVVR